MPHAVTRLVLTRFRNYREAALTLDSSRAFVCLTGVNGVGKTNVLEALSLLAPGRGLRGAPLREMVCQEMIDQEMIDQEMIDQGMACPEMVDQASGWSVAGRLDIDGTERRAATGLEDQNSTRRVIRLDGINAANSAALGRDWCFLWLAPQMDRLLTDGPSARRRFLDQLTLALYPDHGGQGGAYEKAVRERNRLLADGIRDRHWLDLIEARIATHGVAIAAARLDMIAALQTEINGTDEGQGFVAADLSIVGEMEAALLAGKKPSDCEAAFQCLLAAQRDEDSRAGRQATGPHRSDLLVLNRRKNIAAGQCSTGEQKALLMSLILAQSRLIRRLRGAAPILLLDEVAAHLDRNHREMLFAVLTSLNTQIWMTGTEPEIFGSLQKNAVRFHVENNAVTLRREGV